MDSYTALLYNETNLLCLILLLIVGVRTMGNEEIRTRLPSSMGFVVSLILLTIGDIFWAFVNGGIIPFTEMWGYATNMVYFVGTLTSVYYLFMVFEDTMGYHGDYFKKSLLIAIPFVIDLAFVALTPWTRLVFYYADGVYYRGDFYVVALAVPYAFVAFLCVSSFIRSYRPKYFIIRRSLRIMTVYSLGTMLLSLFQLVSKNVFPLYVVGGTLICVMMYMDAVSDMNTVDPLTRLQNRRSLENYLSDVMKKSHDAEKNIYLLMLDIDDFRSVNEIYGREEGNLVLQECAGLIRRTIPTGWFAARSGGDEFAVVGSCAPEEIDHIVTLIANTFDQYNDASTKPYKVMMTTAYAALSYKSRNVFDFIKLAERRLDDASQIAKSRPAVPRKGSAPAAAPAQPAAITQQDINLWMNDALKNGEFVPYFQPQVNVVTSDLSGAEALVRWIHPEKGMITPNVFIPVFERNGFIYEMDKAVWRAVCAKVRAWKDKGIRIPNVSVNVSRWDIVQNDLTETLLKDLEEFSLEPKDLHLEITESAYLFDQDYLLRLMKDLQSHGFVIEMDDFGSGYSSLTAFKDLPFDLIKLDASLIRESTKTRKAASIIEGIVGLAKDLSIPLIAEGIESKEQSDLLQRAGCGNMQGYLFGKPMPEEKFLEFVEEWNKK